MIKRVLAAGINADYILMDSWFSFPAVIATLSRHCPVICMLKNMPQVFYKYEGRWYTLGGLYALLKKRPGRAQRLMTLVIDKIRSTGELDEDVISKMIDAMMGAMVDIMETIHRSHNKKFGIAES